MGKLCVLLSQRPARLRSSYILHIQCINCWPCLLPRPAYYDCCFVCFIYTCRLKFEVSSSDSASEIKEDSDSEMENDWAEEQHSFYNSDPELPVWSTSTYSYPAEQVARILINTNSRTA